MALYPSFTNSRNPMEVSHDPYSGFIPVDASVDNIDLRAEYDRFVRQHGHWVLFRKYDTTRRSRFWDEATQSAVGGPIWEYTDTLTLVCVSGGLGKGAPNRNFMSQIPGGMDKDASVFYLRYDLNPTDVDNIIEITPCSGPRPTSFSIVQMHDTKRVDAMRDARGRVEYYQVLVMNSTPYGDSTAV